MIALISDLHYYLPKTSNNNSQRLEVLHKSLEWVKETAKSKGVKTLAILGDTVEYKDRIDIFVQDTLRQHFIGLREVFETIYLLVGNHETVFSRDNSVNFMSMFDEYKGFRVFHDFEIVNAPEANFYFMPFFKDDVLLEKRESIKPLDRSKKNFLFTHQSFKNFDVGGGHEDVWSEISSEIFEELGFDHIFSGHFHKHQTLGKTSYVSSLITGNFAEKNEEAYHGMIILDESKDKWKFFANPHTPKYRVLEFNKQNVANIMSEGGTFTKFLLKQTYEVEKLYKIKEKLLQNNYDIFFVNDIEVESNFTKIDDWTSIITQSPESILKEFVSHTSGNIDPTKAIEYLEKLA